MIKVLKKIFSRKSSLSVINAKVSDKNIAKQLGGNELYAKYL